MTLSALSAGKLLDQVCYLSREPELTTDLRGEKINVADTFPYNPASKTAPETAKRWVQGYSWREEKKKSTFLQRDNTPFQVSIIDLVVRSEGGRAYKVVDDDGHRFDLREDQLLEALKHVGIAPGGRIQGQFVWGIAGSTTRMVFVGGQQHADMVRNSASGKELDRRRAAGLSPTESSLRIGYVYQKRDKTLHMYLGKVKVPDGKKPLFAFMEMPNCPEKWDGNGRPEYQKKAARSAEVVAQWHQMTWEQRCDYVWREQYVYPDDNRKSFVYHSDIVLMASPKFDVELPDDQANEEFAKSKRVLHQHEMKSGTGVDMAEDWWEKTHNAGRRRDWDRNWASRYTYQQKESDIQKNRVEWREKVEWLA